MAIEHELGDIHDGALPLHTKSSSTSIQYHEERRDRDELMQLGKKPVLKRNFGFMSILGFSCTILITWEAILIVFDTSFRNGGPGGLVYGFMFAWAGSAAIYTCLSELVSMAPTAGGQYHWVSMLAPASWRKFLSYLTGWLTVTGWQALLASAIYVTATLIQGLIVLDHSDYEPRPWHTVLFFWAITVICVIINTVIIFLLPRFEGLIFFLHIAGFFSVLIPLVMLGPHQDASYVFKSFQNGGNWPTQGLSCMVGLVGSVWSFVGADGAVHMSEEIKNASIVVPRSILSSIAVNGSLGFGIIIATLFCIGDPQAAENTLTDYPFMEIFAQATGSVGGASFMVAIVIVMQISADVALLASGSRMLWSFARDRGLPAWRTLARVDPRTSIPLISIILTMIINCLLSLIVLGSSTAFNNFVSIGVIGLQSSYFAAASLLLYRRCTGGIRLSKTADDGVINTIDAQMVWGPWRVPGFWGVAVNIFACIYMIIIMFFTLWPPKLPVTADNMNYSILLIGAVVFFSVVWYHVSAKKQYTGPVIEVLGARRN